MPQSWSAASADGDPQAGYKGNGTTLGTRTTNLTGLFPDSPLYKGELTKDTARDACLEVMQGSGGDGTYGASEGVVSDNSHMFGTFDLNYNGTTQDPRPDVTEVETGGGGLPASPYYPNPNSPGPGNHTAASIPEYTGEPVLQLSSYGSGIGGAANPSDTSGPLGISSQTVTTIGSFMGRSYDGSKGEV